MRGQISLEYLIVIGIAMAIIIPGVLFFYSYTRAGSASSTAGLFNDIGLQMVSTAKSTYASGTGARQTIDVVMPDSVTRIYMSGSELIIVYDTPHGPSEAVFFPEVPIFTPYADGNLSLAHPGLTRYRFITQVSGTPGVLINETI